MQTEIVSASKTSKPTAPLSIRLAALDFKTQPIPGAKASLGTCYVSVVDLPGALDEFMKVNPRLPNRTTKGVLTGPVVAGILETLREAPEQMAIKNRGITILVESAHSEGEAVTLTLTDPLRHGIIDGGHTYAAIQEAIATDHNHDSLHSAFVKLHVLVGVDSDMVPPIAEGLNRSKQVDDPSLVNLQGEFDIIRAVMRGQKGADSIAYHQGDAGSVYISEVLVYLEMFNPERFSYKKHPNGLYNRQSLGLLYFAQDMKEHPDTTKALINLLPDFLWLTDALKKAIPDAALKNGFRFGQMKDKAAKRARKPRPIALPFLGGTTDYRVPNGWVYPILAAFRANLIRTENGKGYAWAVPLHKVVSAVIEELVRVCVVEHRDNGTRPERLGKRESVYEQCFTKVELYLATRDK